MARPRLFNEENVIRDATMAFLEDGPSTTSLEKLETATGVGRKSLYNSFGGKKELLAKAVDVFRCNSVARYVVPLEREGAGLPEILDVIGKLVEQMTDHEHGRGCLLVLSAQDAGLASDPVARQAENYLVRLEQAFVKCIETAVTRGEIKSNMSSGDLAEFCVGVFVGISSMARSGATKKAISGFAKVSLQALS